MNRAPEVRKYERAPIETRVNCLGPGTFFSDFTINISEGGMMVQAISAVQPGTDLEIQFTIPGMGRTLKVTGEVVWSMRNPSEQSSSGVGIGVRFKRIDRQEVDLIRKFVDGRALQSSPD